MPTGPGKQSDRIVGEPMVVGTLDSARHGWDEGWITTGMEDPVFACQAIIRAENLREAGADPGDAYLEGMASLRARQLLAGTGATFRPEDLDVELRLFDPPA